MNFKSILKGVAQVGGSFVFGHPVFANSNANVFSDATTNKIIEAVAAVEIITDTFKSTIPGEEKLSAAAQLVANAILHSPALHNAKPADQERFMRGVMKITDGWNDVVKSCQQSK